MAAIVGVGQRPGRGSSTPSGRAAPADLRRRHRHGGLTCMADSQGKWNGLGRRLPRHRSRHLRRRREGQVHPPHLAAALHRRCSRARSTSLATTRPYDADPRHRARPRFHRRHLLRRPGLPGAQEARREERQGAERRTGLRRAGHYDASSTLADYFRTEQDDLQAGASSRRSTRSALPSSPAVATSTRPMPRALLATRAANAPPPGPSTTFSIMPGDHLKEPLGPVVRHGDNQFADIVRWALYSP